MPNLRKAVLTQTDDEMSPGPSSGRGSIQYMPPNGLVAEQSPARLEDPHGYEYDHEAEDSDDADATHRRMVSQGEEDSEGAVMTDEGAALRLEHALAGYHSEPSRENRPATGYYSETSREMDSHRLPPANLHPSARRGDGASASSSLFGGLRSRRGVPSRRAAGHLHVPLLDGGRLLENEVTAHADLPASRRRPSQIVTVPEKRLPPTRRQLKGSARAGERPTPKASRESSPCLQSLPGPLSQDGLSTPSCSREFALPPLRSGSAERDSTSVR